MMFRQSKDGWVPCTVAEYLEAMMSDEFKKFLAMSIDRQTTDHRGLATPDPTKKPNGTTCAVCGKFHEFRFDMKGKPLPVKCDHKVG